jgi:NAD(P)-dependent dehydrogenase (short-subunit alcohol dehydrogenase family)
LEQQTPDVSLAGWRDTLNTNLTSAFLGAKYQVPAMIRRGGGSLIFTSSFVGYTVGMPGMAAYAASKAGLIGLTEVLAVEFGEWRVRVNAILPGGTDTPFRRAAIFGCSRVALLVSSVATASPAVGSISNVGSRRSRI